MGRLALHDARRRGRTNCATPNNRCGMEITIDTLISIATLLLGGGGGAFFTWRWQRKKAEISAAKELQDMYQQMLEDAKRDREDRVAQVDEIRQERDHYKADRNELRDIVDKMQDEILGMKREIARNGRRVEAMSPFICARSGCRDRIFATVSDAGEVKPKKSQKKQTDKEEKE